MRVLVQEPNQRGVYVDCRNYDQCISVIETALEESVVGTRVTLLKGGEPKMFWRKTDKKKVRRYTPNPVVLPTYKAYCEAVADAYDAAPVVDREEIWRWEKLIEHVERFYDRMLSKVDVEFVSGQPYDSAEQMRREVADSGVLLISKDDNEHPLFTPEQNLKFRAVHDYVVHIIPGKRGPDFTQKGEIKAYNLHRRLAPPDTWPALYTEVVGQACYHSTRGQFPVQKIAVLPFDYYEVGSEFR